MFSQEAHTSIFAVMVSTHCSTHCSTPALPCTQTTPAKPVDASLLLFLLLLGRDFKSAYLIIAVTCTLTLAHTLQLTLTYPHTLRGGGGIDRQGSVVWLGVLVGPLTSAAPCRGIHPSLPNPAAPRLGSGRRADLSSPGCPWCGCRLHASGPAHRSRPVNPFAFASCQMLL